MNKNLLFCIFLSAFAISCSQKEFVPENGDLVFLAAGTSEASQAIVSATAQRDSIKYDHVGIVQIVDGMVFVIEATGKYGVVRTPWHEFLDASPRIDDMPGITAMRVKSIPAKGWRLFRSRKKLADDAVNRAISFMGQPYDWYYLPDNGKLYCSELVYEAWKNAAGKPVFSANPMNFRDIDGDMPQYWINLFSRLGADIPEGVPGTNPTDMSKSPVLKEVHRYFR